MDCRIELPGGKVELDEPVQAPVDLGELKRSQFFSTAFETEDPVLVWNPFRGEEGVGVIRDRLLELTVEDPIPNDSTQCARLPRGNEGGGESPKSKEGGESFGVDLVRL